MQQKTSIRNRMQEGLCRPRRLLSGRAHFHWCLVPCVNSTHMHTERHGIVTGTNTVAEMNFSVCLTTGLGRIGDQVSADPEDPANYDLFAGLEITFKRIGSLITDQMSHIFSLIWS